MKLMDEVAGHKFADDKLDSLCIRGRPETECTMTRGLLFQTIDADIGKTGFAHVGYLNIDEYRRIEEARKQYNEHCEKLMDILRQVCG